MGWYAIKPNQPVISIIFLSFFLSFYTHWASTILMIPTFFLCFFFFSLSIYYFFLFLPQYIFFLLLSIIICNSFLLLNTFFHCFYFLSVLFTHCLFQKLYVTYSGLCGGYFPWTFMCFIKNSWSKYLEFTLNFLDLIKVSWQNYFWLHRSSFGLVWFGQVWFSVISTIVAKSSLYIYIKYIWLGLVLVLWHINH